MWFVNEFRCRDCGSSLGYRSRPKTFSEKYFLPLILLCPVCAVATATAVGTGPFSCGCPAVLRPAGGSVPQPHPPGRLREDCAARYT